MLSSMVLVLIVATGGTGLDTEALPCPNPVSAWAGAMGPDVTAWGIAVDDGGSFLVCGRFSEGTDLDPTEGVYHPEAHGLTADAYVVKVNPDGSFAWAYTVGGDAGSDTATGVGFTPSGDIVAVGSFRGTVDFDPTDAVDEHTSLGDYAAFVTWLSPEGAYLDTLIQSGSGEAGVHDLALDRDGNIILIGFFSGWIDFDPGPDVWMGVGVSDVFVTKLGPDGSHLWTHTIGSWGLWDGPKGITVDLEGNVFALYERRLKNVALGRYRRSVEKRSALASLAVFGSHRELVMFLCELKAARAIKGVYGHGEVGRDSTSGQSREA